MKQTNKPTNKIIGGLIALSVLAIPAQAAVLSLGTEIGIDFGPTAPTNNMNQSAATDVLFETLATVIGTDGVTVDGVGFSWTTTSTNTFSNGDADEGQASQPIAFNTSNLTDWLGAADNGGDTDSITLTFTGLDNGFTYDLTVGAAFAGDVADTLWAVDGQSATNDTSAAGSSWLTFTGLSTDGSGNLVITGTGTPSRPDIFGVAGMTLTAAAVVPEPSSTALLGLGGLALILRRRR